MPWTSPSNPVSGTVITVAYAITNILDNLKHLRLLLGNSDPPGSNYVPVSTSTSGVSWQKVPLDAIAEGIAVASLGYTPVNRAGDSGISGNLGLGNQIALQGKETGGTALRNLAYVSADNRSTYGDANLNLQLVGGASPKYNQGGTEFPLWHGGNDGAGSGLDADLLDGQHASAFAAVGHTHSGGSDVPAGLIAAFETAAAIPAGWSRYSAADGRLLVGAGTTFEATYTQATNYGTSWLHQHTSNSFTVSASGTGSGSTGAVVQESSPVTRLQVSGTGSDPNFMHHHDGVSVTVAVTGTATGSTSNAQWTPPMRAVVWAQKS